MKSGFATVSSFVFVFSIACFSASVAREGWRTEREPTFGFSYSYPEHLFNEVGGEDRPSFHYFESAQSDAKFLVGAWDNEKEDTPDSFKRWLTANAEDYEDLTYRPRGRSWFVLSGYRGDQIYYEKVMFSCGGRVVNILAVAYPVASRRIFDPVVERMEDRFRPSRQCS